EKPFLTQPGQYLCSSCIYRLPSSIFKAIEKIETEFLQDAFNLTIKENEKYFVYDKQFVAYDIGTMQGLETTRKLLKDYKIKK
ncbi:MAG: hypothetical protein LBF02_00790, partial [Mycoplasmataceae bacterium]|nr:hypothetical protein [Mycoplasmataceae bacterium]